MLGGFSSQNLWQKPYMILISIIIFERTRSKLKFYCFANIKAKTPFKMKATLFGPSVDSRLHCLHHQTQHTITQKLQQSVPNQTSLHLMT